MCGSAFSPANTAPPGQLCEPDNNAEEDPVGEGTSHQNEGQTENTMEVNNEVNNVTLISHASMKRKLTTTTSEDDTTTFTSGVPLSSSFHTSTASSINPAVEPAQKKSSKHSSLGLTKSQLKVSKGEHKCTHG
jgi:hypothetical protein